VTNIVAQPAPSLFRRAKLTAERLSRKRPPLRPSASRATQSHCDFGDEEQRNRIAKRRRRAAAAFAKSRSGLSQLSETMRSLLSASQSKAHRGEERRACQVALLYCLTVIAREPLSLHKVFATDLSFRLC